MKTFIACVFFLLGVNGALSAAVLNDLGGGFAYVPTGNGRCQVLFDAKYAQPVFQLSKRAPSKVVLIGPKKDCPAEYDGYKVIRYFTGQVNGYIYTATSDYGSRLYIYRKMGSSFTFRPGTKPKKK